MWLTRTRSCWSCARLVGVLVVGALGPRAAGILPVMLFEQPPVAAVNPRRRRSRHVATVSAVGIVLAVAGCRALDFGPAVTVRVRVIPGASQVVLPVDSWILGDVARATARVPESLDILDGAQVQVGPWLRSLDQ